MKNRKRYKAFGYATMPEIILGLILSTVLFVVPCLLIIASL